MALLGHWNNKCDIQDQNDIRETNTNTKRCAFILIDYARAVYKIRHKYLFQLDFFHDVKAGEKKKRHAYE